MEQICACSKSCFKLQLPFNTIGVLVRCKVYRTATIVLQIVAVSQSIQKLPARQFFLLRCLFLPV